MLAAAGKATRLSPWNSPMAYTAMISNRRSLLPPEGVTSPAPSDLSPTRDLPILALPAGVRERRRRFEIRDPGSPGAGPRALGLLDHREQGGLRPVF